MLRKRIVALWFAVMLMAMAALQLSAQDTRTQENRRAKLEQEIAVINRQLKDNSAKSSSALSSIKLLQKKISNRNALIGESNREIKEIERSIARKQQELEVLGKRLDTLTSYYDRLVKNAYRNRDAKVWYMYIFGSENIGQAMRRMGYLKNLSSQMNVQAKKILRTKAEIEEESTRLQAMKADAEALRTKRQVELNSLKSEEDDSQKLVAKLKKDRKKYEKELAAKKKQVEALNREIERIIREATKASSGSGSTKTGSKTTVDHALDAEFAKNKGKLPWPADGPVIDKYGQHYHPVYTSVKLPFNNGITMAVAPGTRVKSVFEGVVKQIVVMPGYNKCVLVQHGNYFSFYCKLGIVSVKAGDKVRTGDIIGTVDTLDGETQLHFQIWQGTKPQNPELWLKK